MNCPFCHQILYSRQHAKCGFCGKELPPEYRLEPHQIEELKAEMREIDSRRAIAREQEEEERREAARRNSDSGYAGF
jgi:DNA repair exonuclease SbcCD ATPase subunit